MANTLCLQLIRVISLSFTKKSHKHNRAYHTQTQTCHTFEHTINSQEHMYIHTLILTQTRKHTQTHTHTHLFVVSATRLSRKRPHEMKRPGMDMLSSYLGKNYRLVVLESRQMNYWPPMWICCPHI